MSKFRLDSLSYHPVYLRYLQPCSLWSVQACPRNACALAMCHLHQASRPGGATPLWLAPAVWSGRSFNLCIHLGPNLLLSFRQLFICAFTPPTHPATINVYRDSGAFPVLFVSARALSFRSWSLLVYDTGSPSWHGCFARPGNRVIRALRLNLNKA